MPTVLILESDPLSRVHYLRALSGLPGACVLASSSESEAKTLVSALTPDVVVADARWLQQGRNEWLPQPSEGSGPSFVAIQEPTPQTLHTSNFPVIACLAKPVEAVELRRAVQGELAKVAPDLCFGLSEYIQLACQGRRSLQLACTSPSGSGVITIEQGHVWSASYEGMTGFGALALALSQPNTTVALWPPLACTHAREIAGDWQLLLASAVRYSEQRNAEPSAAPEVRELDFSDVLTPTMVPASMVIESGQKLRSSRGGYESLLVDAVAAAISQRYADALAMFEEAYTLAPDNLAVRNRVAWVRALSAATSADATALATDAQS